MHSDYFANFKRLQNSEDSYIKFYTLAFFSSGERTSMSPANDPVMAAATSLGES